MDLQNAEAFEPSTTSSTITPPPSPSASPLPTSWLTEAQLTPPPSPSSTPPDFLDQWYLNALTLTMLSPDTIKDYKLDLTHMKPFLEYQNRGSTPTLPSPSTANTNFQKAYEKRVCAHESETYHSILTQKHRTYRNALHHTRKHRLKRHTTLSSVKTKRWAVYQRSALGGTMTRPGEEVERDLEMAGWFPDAPACVERMKRAGGEVGRGENLVVKSRWCGKPKDKRVDSGGSRRVMVRNATHARIENLYEEFKAEQEMSADRGRIACLRADEIRKKRDLMLDD